MTKKDYYETLGVKKTDSEETIKKQYKKLAIKFHPDKASNEKERKEYEEKFKSINEAYAVLSNPEKKKQYDTMGQNPFGNFSGFRNQGGGMGDLSDIFEQLFRGSGFRGREKYENLDLYNQITIEFTEAAFGTEKEITIEKNTPCEKCEGTGSSNKKFEKCEKCSGIGRIQIRQQTPWGIMAQETECNECKGTGKKIKNPCRKCNGEGLNQGKEKIKIKIPAGIDNGQTIRIQNAGNINKNKQKGDLLLKIRVLPHKIFKRENFDIYMKFPISFSKAALGGEIEIPTLESDLKIKIKKSTQTGSILRLKGEGIPFINNPKQRGDQFIEIIVETPKKLSRKQIKLLKELEKLEK